MKSRFIPLCDLGERLVATGLDQDEADLYVLRALQRGALMARGVDDSHTEGFTNIGPRRDRETISQYWWRHFRPLSGREAGTFSTVRNAAGYNVEPPSPEALTVLAKAKLIDRTADPITGDRIRGQWRAYRWITVEAEGAEYLVESLSPAPQPKPARGRGRPPNPADQAIIDRIAAIYGPPQAQLDDAQLAAWINRHIEQMATEIDRKGNLEAAKRRIKPKVLQALQDRR